MKRSEIVGRVVRRLAPLAPREDPFEVANLVAGELEAAGVVWDPEEEPMAERLGCGTRGGEWALFADGDVARPASEAELRLAADLYNRREAIAAVAYGCRYRVGRGQGATAADLLRWADMLEGK